MSPGRPNLQEERQKGSIEADRKFDPDFVTHSNHAGKSRSEIAS